MRLSELWSAYLADKRLLGYSAYTLKAYRLQLNLMVRVLGDVPIESLNTNHLKGYLARDAERLKPSSLGHRVRFIKSIFRYAQDEGFIVGNAAAKLREPKQGSRIPKAMSEEDVEMLREACVSPMEHAIVEFLFTTGCRIGEAVGLNRNSVVWESRSVIVRGKGDKEREVYFNTKCQIWLRRYLRERNDTDMALFVTERKPHRMSIAQMRYVIKRVARRAGVHTNVYPHKLRHTYATQLLNNGAPLEVIQSLLGHTKLETTKLYANLSGQLRQELYRKYF